MSIAEQLSRLRPLMTRAEIEALLGPEQTKRALDILSNPQRDTGVSIGFSHADGVIDSITFTAYFKFPGDVPVCGLRIGMTVDDMQMALPELRLADGTTSEPDKHGFVRYQAQPAALNVAIAFSIKDGQVFAISLDRGDADEVRAQRERQKADLAASAPTDGNPFRIPMKCCWPGPSIARPGTTPPRRNSSRSPAGLSQRQIRMSGTSSQRTGIGITAGRRCLWIIRQKNCDIATALEVFFLADPSYYFRYGDDRPSVPADWHLEIFDFLAEIRQRLARGFYKRSEIAFDGGQMAYINRGLTTAEEKALARRFFPPEAGQKIAGRDPANSDDAVVRKSYGMLTTLG